MDGVSLIPASIGDDLARARQKDPLASQALVEHLYPLVIRIVRSHLPRRVAEEDLVQEVYLKIFTRLEQYREREGVPFEHWVSRLAVRTCLDQLRAERRRPEWRWSDLSAEEAAWLEFMMGSQDSAPETSPESAREALERLMRELSPSDRLVITLLDLEQRTVKEISRITGWSIPGVKVRAFRARQRLRRVAAKQSKQRHEV